MGASGIERFRGMRLGRRVAPLLAGLVALAAIAAMPSAAAADDVALERTYRAWYERSDRESARSGQAISALDRARTRAGFLVRYRRMQRQFERERATLAAGARATRRRRASTEIGAAARVATYRYFALGVAALGDVRQLWREAIFGSERRAAWFERRLVRRAMAARRSLIRARHLFRRAQIERREAREGERDQPEPEPQPEPESQPEPEPQPDQEPPSDEDGLLPLP